MRAFRLDLLCIVGGAIGIVAVLFPSVTVTTVGMQGFVTSTKNLGGLALADYLLAVPVMLFVLGSVMAFLTPIGGFFQATGLGVMSGTLLAEHWPHNEYHPSYGLALAFVSCILVLLSLRYSVWAVHAGRHTDRLLTILAPSEESAHDSCGGESEARTGSRLTRMNLLCLVGATVGLLSFVMSWVTMFLPLNISPEFDGFVVGPSTWEYVSGIAGLLAALYVLGAIISFVTPLGGALQVASSVSFFLALSDQLKAHTIISGHFAYDISLNLGFFIALFAGLLVMASIALQRHLPRRAMCFSSSKWIWTWSSGGPVQSASSPAAGSYRINALSLFGSLVGIVALFGAWMSVGLNLTDMTGPIPYGHASFIVTILWGDNVMGLGALLFLAGVILSIGSQLGGGLQVAGLACFLIGTRVHPGLEGMTTSFALGIGFFLAVASAALVIAGALRPIWFGMRRQRIGWFDRLIVPGASTHPGSRHPGSRFGSLSWIAKPTRWEGRLRVNLACVVGAVLGIISLSFAWARLPDLLFENSVGYVTMDPMSKEALSSDMIIPLLFLFGCLVSFLSPLGGVLQVGAAAAFFFRFGEIYGAPWIPGLGFKLGLFSGILVLISPLYIVGPGNWDRGPRGLARLFAWGVRPADVSGMDQSDDESRRHKASS